MFFTTSWDDGHPLDLKLADLLDEFGIAGTFYCPISNREGLSVLDSVGMRELDSRFELGSHTLSHTYSSQVSQADWREEVKAGKAALESVLGHSVAGFCYPGGRVSTGAKAIVSEAGFRYARSTKNLCMGPGTDVYMLPTTLQFYPHAGAVLLRNFLRHGHWRSRLGTGLKCLAAGSLGRRLEGLLDQHSDSQTVLHIWGHSWEIEALGLWPDLRAFLTLVADRVPPEYRITNGELARRAGSLAEAASMPSPAT